MVITKMNSIFVKHGRWFFGAFTIIIIISFVWFFTPGLDGSIFFPNPNSPSAVVGKCFGKKVTRANLIDTTGAMSLAVSASYGMPVNDSRVRDMAWARAFETYTSLEAAKRLGIGASDDEVVQYIKAMPAFRGPNGAFDKTRFETYRVKVLEPSGNSAADLDNAVRDLLILMKIERLAASQAIVTADEVRQYQLSNGERLDVRAARFHAKDFENEVPISEDALKSFYAANQKIFILPPKYQAELVKFNYASYEKEAAAQVTDAIVKDYYNKNQAEFKKGDKGEVVPFAEASVKIRKGMIDSLSKALAFKAAKKFREELYEATADLTDGSAHLATFRRLAKERGFDTSETGWFDAFAENVKNVGKEPALVDSLASASKRYPIAKLANGSRAAFVAVLIDKRDAAPGEYNEVKSKVEESYRQLKAISLAREKAADAALKISEAKNVSAAVDAFAAAGNKVKFEKVESFSQDDPPNVKDASDVMELALPLQPGKLSKTKEIADGAMLVFVDKRTAPSEADLAKGREQAEALFKQRKKMALVDSFNSWLSSNCEKYVNTSASDER